MQCNVPKPGISPFSNPTLAARLRLDIAEPGVQNGRTTPDEPLFVATFADSLNLLPAQQLRQARQRGAPLVRRESRKRQNNGQLVKYPYSNDGLFQLDAD